MRRWTYYCLHRIRQTMIVGNPPFILILSNWNTQRIRKDEIITRTFISVLRHNTKLFVNIWFLLFLPTMLSKCNIATDLIISHKINILKEKEQWTDSLFHVIFNSIICETYARLCLAWYYPHSTRKKWILLSDTVVWSFFHCDAQSFRSKLFLSKLAGL